MYWLYHCGYVHQYLQSLNSHLCALRHAHTGCWVLLAVPALWGWKKNSDALIFQIFGGVVGSILANICAHQLTLLPPCVAAQGMSSGILLGAWLGFVAVSSTWSSLLSYLLFHLLLGIIKENIQHFVKNSLELPPDITLWHLSLQRISWFNKKEKNPLKIFKKIIS